MNSPLPVERIYEILRTVDDPEIGINIVDLGFIYDVKSDESGVDLQMGFTTAACPMRELILAWVRAALGGETTREIRIDTETAPPWTPARIRREALAEEE